MNRAQRVVLWLGTVVLVPMPQAVQSPEAPNLERIMTALGEQDQVSIEDVLRLADSQRQEPEESLNWALILVLGVAAIFLLIQAARAYWLDRAPRARTLPEPPPRAQTLPETRQRESGILNIKQLVVLWLGTLALVLAVLFPPWMTTHARQWRAVGLAPLLSPPGGVSRVDTTRLGCEVVAILAISAALLVTLRSRRARPAPPAG